MNRRMAAVLLTPGNDVCADCPAKRPVWVSFLVSPVEEDRPMAVLCCATCARHHHFELGEKRAHIKCLKMSHEWIPADISVMEDSGNALINACFEANLTQQEFDKDEVHQDEQEEDSRRAKFIKQKYKKLRFFDEVIYHQQILAILQQRDEQRR